MKLVNPPLAGKPILLVSDDEKGATAIARALAKEGAALTVVRSSAVAELRPAPKFSLVLFDEPSAPDGLAGLRTVHQQPALAGAATIVLSSTSSRAKFSRALECGADDVVDSGTPIEQLLSRVHCHLRLQSTVVELGQKQNDAKVVLELTQALSSSLDLQEILFTVVERIAEVVNVSRASIVLSPEPAEESVGYVVATSDDMQLSNLRIDLSRYPEIQEVLRTQQSLTIHDVKTHPLLDRVRGQVPSHAFSSMTLVPIVWQNQASGVLFLRATEGRGQLSERDLHLCQIVANTTAIALRNARIMQSLRDHTQKVTFARFEAERKLRYLERYADLFDSLSYGIVVMDEDGHLLFANPRANQLTGQDWESYTGQSVMKIVHPDDRARAQNLWNEFSQGMDPTESDFRLLRPDGSSMVASVSASRLLHREGAMLLTFRDVTETRRIESELVRTKEFLESLIQASVNGIVACDIQGKIILFNPGAERIYGYTAEEVVGIKLLPELYEDGVADRVMAMLQAEQYGGVGRMQNTRVNGRSKSGEAIPLSLSAAHIVQEGQPQATFLIFTDLRDRIQIEERLAHAQQKLAVTEKQALIAELAGTAAHELNQPLTSVMGYGEMLKRKLTVGSSEHNAADIIVREAERMAEIVRNIGRITKYETKSYVGSQRILDLDASVDTDPKHPGDSDEA